MSLKIGDWLKKADEQLKHAGISTSRLDSLILLQYGLEKDKSWILANTEVPLEPAALTVLNSQLKRRTAHEPLSYIIGSSEFYRREFIVNNHTLEPRPETETMIDMILKLKPRKLLDVGTGSGCIAVTASLELPDCQVTAIDISTECLQTARQNAKKLGAPGVRFVKSDLLEQCEARDISGSLLCCNLPYVPDGFTINQAAMFEPRIAIFGGMDGLDHYRRLFSALAQQNGEYRPQGVLTESLPTQHIQLATIAQEAGYSLSATNDFIQLFAPTG
jgi:release factor glutamine methyltransferase